LGAVDLDRAAAYLRSGVAALPRRLTVRHRTLTPFIEVRILAGHPGNPPDWRL